MSMWVDDAPTLRDDSGPRCTAATNTTYYLHTVPGRKHRSVQPFSPLPSASAFLGPSTHPLSCCHLVLAAPTRDHVVDYRCTAGLAVAHLQDAGTEYSRDSFIYYFGTYEYVVGLGQVPTAWRK